MGDVPRPNPSFFMTCYSCTATTAAGEHRSQHPHHRDNNHHQLLQEANYVPYFYSYSPYTFASDLQTDYFSRPFHGAGRPAVPFSGSEFDSETDAELDMDPVSEEDADFLVDDQVSFITDLFERPAEDSNLSLGLALGLGQIDEDMDDCNDSYCAGLGVGIEGSDFSPEVDLELGLGLGMDLDDVGKLGRGDCSEFAGVSGQGPSFLGGLRVVDIDSESDSDQNLAFDPQILPSYVEIDERERICDFDHLPFCWDYYEFNQQQQNQNQSNDFEWQEQAEGGEEAVLDPIAVAQNDWYHNRRHNDDADDQLHLHSDSEEDREIEDPFDVALNLEWEIMVAVNNLNMELDDDESMFGVVEESTNEWRGNPPAALSVVETLKVVHLSHEEIKENEITCAICWSEISATEPLRQLPCRHYYHGDCIITWLGIRNTCPVCRYELPTDDLEYEYQKREMVDGRENGGGGEFPEDLPVNYENFHVFL